MAVKLLNPLLLLFFVLAVISSVLSTIDSATMAAASIFGQNLILHLPMARQWRLSEKAILRLQRICVVLVAILSLATSFSGQTAYELLRDSYSMTLVGLFVPLMAGLYWKEVTHRATLSAMLAGIVCWFTHWCLGWDYALQGWLEPNLPSHLQGLAQVPQELLATAGSLLGLILGANQWKFTLNRDHGNPTQASS
jgi:Na+/proline symporter